VTTKQLSIDLQVRHRAEISEDVIELELVDPTGIDLPAWTPGSHIDVLAGDVIRQYSLTGTSDEASVWRIAVLREQAGGGGSEWLHKRQVGDLLTVCGVRNHFELASAPEYLFIAGGIGITPLVPMIEQAVRAGASWRLVHIGRNTSRLPYGVHLAERFPGQVTLAPADTCGRTEIAALIAGAPRGALVYCCGPEAMMREAEEAGQASDVEVRVERFVPRELEREAAAERAFEVELAESGLILTVPPDRSILDTVTDAGVFVLSSCTEGTCGSCETDVLAGEVDHRDSILTANERASNTVMFVCCSRACGDRLVLRL
jgi:ferredoxin-NADP reductase